MMRYNKLTTQNANLFLSYENSVVTFVIKVSPSIWMTYNE